MKLPATQFYCALLCCGLFVAAQLLPAHYQDLLPLRRVAVGDGEWWRIFSAHALHLSWLHLLLNGAVLIIFQGLYRGLFTWRHWALCLPLLTAGVSFGLLWFSPKLNWYMGFSGVLTGLLVAAAIQLWRSMPLINAVVLTAIGIKVFMEQLSGQTVIVSPLGHIPTAIDAHLYGAICGAFCGVMGVVLRR